MFQGLTNSLTWSNGFCGERGKRGGMLRKGKGPWPRNAVIIDFNELILGVEDDMAAPVYYIITLYSKK